MVSLSLEHADYGVGNSSGPLEGQVGERDGKWS
jgi:hypothetical protein